MWYLPIFPMGGGYAALGLFFRFWVDKHALLRRWARQPDMGGTMLMNSNIQMIMCLSAAIIMCNRYYAAWPFDNQCLDPEKPGEHVLCTRWQNGLLFGTRDYMGDDQIFAVQGFGLAFVIGAGTFGAYFLLFESYCSVANLFCGINESDGAGQAFENKFTTVDEIEAYVPQIRVKGLETPLLACNLGLFDPEYIDWQGKYANYDLYADSKKMFGGLDDLSMEGRIFSTCKLYPTEANPDPLHKVDDGDHGAGAMWVTIDKCEGLLVGDINGLSDPKVKLTYEDMNWITVTVQNELDPDFDENFRVPVWEYLEKGDPKGGLIACVTDEDDYLGLTFDFLGQIKLDMATLIEECLAAQAEGEMEVSKVIPLLDKHFKCSHVDEAEREIHDDTDEAGTRQKLNTDKLPKNAQHDHQQREKHKFAKQVTKRQCNTNAPRGTISMKFTWQPHYGRNDGHEQKQENSLRLTTVQEGAGVDALPSPIQEAGVAGHEHERKRSSAGYMQDMSPEQLAAVVATEAGTGMRFMV
jgi:hypothetical protein